MPKTRYNQQNTLNQNDKTDAVLLIIRPYQDSTTPMHLAAAGGHLAVVEALRAAGGNVKARNKV